MSMETTMSGQLFNRPDDEHFASFGDIQKNAQEQKDGSIEEVVEAKKFLFTDRDTVHIDERELSFNNFSMKKIMNGVPGISLDGLSLLTPQTRGQVINEVFNRKGVRQLLIQDNKIIRAITSDRYTRIYDVDVLDQIKKWIGEDFVPALPTINTDDEQNNVKGNNKPALFRGDRDMYVFFYSKERNDDTDDFGGLRKGIIIWNSEVGHKTFGYSTFFFRDMCANFLIWDCTNQKTKRAPHLKNVWETFEEFVRELHEISADISEAEMDKLAQSMKMPFVGNGTNNNANIDNALDKLNSRYKFSEQESLDILTASFQPQNINKKMPLSVFSVVNGITWQAKEKRWASDQVNLSERAGKLLTAEVS